MFVRHRLLGGGKTIFSVFGMRHQTAHRVQIFYSENCQNNYNYSKRYANTKKPWLRFLFPVFFASLKHFRLRLIWCKIDHLILYNWFFRSKIFSKIFYSTGNMNARRVAKNSFYARIHS